MGVYDISKATTLSTSELASLKVTGMVEFKNKMADFSGGAQIPTAGVLMAVESGKVKGSKWVLTGDLGQASVHTQRLGGDRGQTVTLDLSDLTKFRFDGETDPRNGANRSDWVPVQELMVKIESSRDKTVTTDPKSMEEDNFIKKGGCSVRVTILPTGAGKAALWMGAAPGSPTMIKEVAQKKGLEASAATIPTVAVKLGSKSESCAKIRVAPAEGKPVSKGWGIYPLLLVSPESNQTM